MGLKYVVAKQVFAFDETKSEKYVVKQVSSGKISFSKLCTQVGQICGAHRGTVQLVIAGLVDVLVNNIEDGKSVQLGEFGTFRPAINAKAADTEEEANATKIYRKTVKFTPGAALKNTLENASVTRYAWKIQSPLPPPVHLKLTP
ncbi:HU family DNA-binding protein [Bacteroides thetaiotaomicron]|uniref:HU family DNA-binding protein n=1 Tax=Bacteroides thetaiotaomicron TaxID=818 RepID=UPI00189A0DE1|nr:HU family DNA-binding protein [Bacteroides thetaiotaomicron]